MNGAIGVKVKNYIRNKEKYTSCLLLTQVFSILNVYFTPIELLVKYLLISRENFKINKRIQGSKLKLFLKNEDFFLFIRKKN